MRLAWLTDIHLNFVDEDNRQRFLQTVKEQADAVAVSGDIGESRDVAQYLVEMAEVIQEPIYFVLGNHDFYHGSITKTRLRIAELARETEHLNYLTTMGTVQLTPTTAIMGHDGWPDGRLGDYQGTEVILSDHRLIAEIAQWLDGSILDKRGLSRTMTTLADEAAHHFEWVLAEAASTNRKVIALTHVPPFKEAAWYQGTVSGDDYLPYFACQVVGDVMRQTMARHHQSQLLVLCGHTHSGGEVQVADNLRVLTGEAEYGKPRISGIFDVE